MQRVAIARALAHRPSLVLADEPTGNLDADSAAEVLALLRAQLKRDNAAGILVTHSEVAAATAQRDVSAHPPGTARARELNMVSVAAHRCRTRRTAASLARPQCAARRRYRARRGAGLRDLPDQPFRGRRGFARRAQPLRPGRPLGREYCRPRRESVSAHCAPSPASRSRARWWKSKASLRIAAPRSRCLASIAFRSRQLQPSLAALAGTMSSAGSAAFDPQAVFLSASAARDCNWRPAVSSRSRSARRRSSCGWPACCRRPGWMIAPA